MCVYIYIVCTIVIYDNKTAANEDKWGFSLFSIYAQLIT
jgi:hypothetical protein